MVSTATPAARANCSIRYSMSTYSNPWLECVEGTRRSSWWAWRLDRQAGRRVRGGRSELTDCDGALAGALPRYLAGRIPVIHAVQPRWVVAVGAGERLHRIDVVERVVVVPDRVAHVGRRAVVHQVAGGAKDRVMRVVDVAAGPKRRPCARKELHRSQRAGG